MLRGAVPFGGAPPAVVATDWAWRGRTSAEEEARRRDMGRIVDLCMMAGVFLVRLEREDVMGNGF